ncbi:MAG: hypothetical protein C5B53_01590 [Candidatus Melainabacteria bacterium]|nr:MAG: hypothetical protein C5B53_01590 [Candidatus Melainabacteria bacterium]
MLENDSSKSTDSPSCVVGMSRKQFVTRLLKRAAIGGAILALATEINRYMLPPSHASATGTGTSTT